MLSTLVQIFMIIGTVSFGISGAVKGMKCDMDVIGVAVLGLLTAVGGGVLRDIIIGATPPAVFSDPIYAIVAIVSAIATFVIFYVAKPILSKKAVRAEELAMLITDTLGLGAATVIGVETALNHGHSSFILLVFVGVITGTGGGIMRDICAGTVPAVFVRHIYMLACVAGAVVFALLDGVIGRGLSMVLGFATVVVIRFLAAHFKWNMPRISDRKERKE